MLMRAVFASAMLLGVAGAALADTRIIYPPTIYELPGRPYDILSGEAYRDDDRDFASSYIALYPGQVDGLLRDFTTGRTTYLEVIRPHPRIRLLVAQ